ncbi:serine peptidase [Streptomyces prunicolor]|uniref:serine peptidase n=1 Tax=Streptomyces prunicolor TaxID=67348 RepID=UPI00225650F9|nr:serine peptidase [Streptomyces prunicolor]MCX5238957.1 serine peptidase [Streptomyces prunicolor]
MTIVAVHGIGNHLIGRSPEQAAAELAGQWQLKLQHGFTATGLGDHQLPALHVAYYAHHTHATERQAVLPDVHSLDEREQSIVIAWALALGSPTFQERQGLMTAPLRQVLSWVSQRRNIPIRTLIRLAVQLAGEVRRYLHVPHVRAAARSAVAESIRRVRPRVVLAHSLGSVVAYEALHAHPELTVDCLVTLGSPLGLPGGIFDHLVPAPISNRGARPAGVRYWVNLADTGDLVAIPLRLGDRFPVDQHADTPIGRIDFHSFGAYLSSPLTAAAISPFVRNPTIPDKDA